jgi:hypothetical protein
MFVPGIVACVLAFDPLQAAGNAPAAAPQAVPMPAPGAAAPATVAPAAPFLDFQQRPYVTIDLDAWVPRLTGTAKVGAGGTKFELNHDLAVDDSVPAFAGEIAVWLDRWRVGMIGFQSSAGSTERAGVGGTFGNTVITAGDTISGTYSAWMVGVEAGYVLWRPFADRPLPWDGAGANRDRATSVLGANGRPRFDAQVLVIGGAMCFDYQQQLTDVTTGSSSSFDKFVGCVYGGVGLDLWMGFDGRVPLVQDVRLYADVGIGPSIPDADILWMIRAGVCMMFTQNVGIELGYRLFDFNLQSGPSDVDGGLRGLFGGLTVKF